MKIFLPLLAAGMLLCAGAPAWAGDPIVDCQSATLKLNPGLTIQNANLIEAGRKLLFSTPNGPRSIVIGRGQSVWAECAVLSAADAAVPSGIKAPIADTADLSNLKGSLEDKMRAVLDTRLAAQAKMQHQALQNGLAAEDRKIDGVNARVNGIAAALSSVQQKISTLTSRMDRVETSVKTLARGFSHTVFNVNGILALIALAGVGLLLAAKLKSIWAWLPKPRLNVKLRLPNVRKLANFVRAEKHGWHSRPYFTAPLKKPQKVSVREGEIDGEFGAGVVRFGVNIDWLNKGPSCFITVPVTCQRETSGGIQYMGYAPWGGPPVSIAMYDRERNLTFSKRSAIVKMIEAGAREDDEGLGVKAWFAKGGWELQYQKDSTPVTSVMMERGKPLESKLQAAA